MTHTKDAEKNHKKGHTTCPEVFYIHPIPPIYIMGKSCCVCPQQRDEEEQEELRDDKQCEEKEKIRDECSEERKKRELICRARDQYNSRYDNFYNNYNITEKVQCCKC